jgi:hypothetical protein
MNSESKACREICPLYSRKERLTCRIEQPCERHRETWLRIEAERMERKAKARKGGAV